MILLDSNVLSELMLARPDPAVVRRLDGLEPDAVWISSVALHEVRLGLLMSPTGRRRAQRETVFERLLRDVVRGRVAQFDAKAAEASARLAASRRARGRPVGLADTQIAGIAIARRATICTRNVRRFEDAGVPVLNPWV